MGANRNELFYLTGQGSVKVSNNHVGLLRGKKSVD